MTKKKTNPKKKNSPSLPNGVSEEDFLKVLDNISKRLGHKFRFGYHDFDDMKQQAAIFAIEGLEKYDNSRPLENFLWTHVRNRLFNYKRNNYQRPDKPCLTCPFFDKGYRCSLNQCEKYTDKSECDLYAAWSARNESKKNIMQPHQIEDESSLGTYQSNFVDSISDKELILFLDQNVESEYREDYLRLKHGDKVTKNKLQKLQNHVLELIDQYKNSK